MAETIYDVVIIGAGPAGIQAAIHAARRKIRVLMLGRIENSALFGAHIENYAFVPGVTTGAVLLQGGLEQARGFGTEIAPEDVLKIIRTDEMFHLELESGRSIVAAALVFSMGVAKKKLNVPGEKELLGRGVSYCVDCDANFFRNAVVTITGDRSAAVDGALTMLDYAAKVYLVSERLDVSPELALRLKTSKVECIPSAVRQVNGERAVTSVAALFIFRRGSAEAGPSQ